MLWTNLELSRRVRNKTKKNPKPGATGRERFDLLHIESNAQRARIPVLEITLIFFTCNCAICVRFPVRAPCAMRTTHRAHHDSRSARHTARTT